MKGCVTLCNMGALDIARPQTRKQKIQQLPEGHKVTQVLIYTPRLWVCTAIQGICSHTIRKKDIAMIMATGKTIKDKRL